jgi:uncharacterized protein
MNMKIIDIVTLVLLVVGGLNWGLVGVAKFDLVAMIAGLSFGQTSMFSSAIYLLVGLSAVYQGVTLNRQTSKR